MLIALAVPLDAERLLTASAAHHGHEVALVASGGDELALRLPHAPVERVLVAATPQHLTPRLIEACDALGIRMLVVADDAESHRHAARVGIVDAVPGPLEWGLLDGRPRADELPLEPVPAVPPGGASRREGRVIAVWGSHGAPGRTSLAISLAAEFASAGLGVILADADVHAASIAPALGMLDEAPGFAAACRLAGVGGLDAAQLDRLAQPHRAGTSAFRVLTGIGRAARWPELGAERVAGVLQAARRQCDALIVDVAASLEDDEEIVSDLAAPRRNAATLEVLRSADVVVAVAAADPVGIARFLRAHAELAEIVEAERIVIAVNKVRASAIGLNPGGQVAQTLARFGGISDVVLIPWEPGGFDAALLGGATIVDTAPRSAARTAIRALAERTHPVLAAHRARRRGMRRLA